MASALGWRATAGINTAVDITTSTSILPRRQAWLPRCTKSSYAEMVEPRRTDKASCIVAREMAEWPVPPRASVPDDGGTC